MGLQADLLTSDQEAWLVKSASNDESDASRRFPKSASKCRTERRLGAQEFCRGGLVG